MKITGHSLKSLIETLIINGLSSIRLFPIILALIFSGSVLSQTTWEFSGMPYAFQKTHFDSATNVIKAKLGVQMHTFGAPYNQIDATFLQVMSEDPNYKVLLFGQLSPTQASGQINLTNRVNIESATGVPDYNYFLTEYNSKKVTYTDYMVMQGHPYAWTTQTKLTEFQTIVNFLIAEGVVFNTPYGYYKYLTDNTIPRTNKVQVILKLDDLRATAYFAPCLPTYDFLAANKVKASFGVNKMEALTQSQIDTLHYYLSQTTSSGDTLFEIWNHGLDHSMTASTIGGNWSDPATWPSGEVPTSADDVEIPMGVSITLDSILTGAECNNLTINGTLVASNTNAATLTVKGNLLINSGGSFTSPSLTGATANIIHSLSVYGDFTNAGGIFDFRTGSAGTTMRMINTTFPGSLNSTITVGTYSSTNNDFNSITVNKSNGAKIICSSDVVLDAGASTGRSQLTLTNGMVETGNHAIYALSTTGADVIIPSPTTSYINGALGRGMSNSAGKSLSFQVGDAGGYRPIVVRSTTAGTATGHSVLVRCIPADASSVTPSFTGGIDGVSKMRYYQISYNKGLGAGAVTMGFSQFSPSYGEDDGVAEGNSDLRVAYSTDEKTTWNGMEQLTAHITSLTSPPTTIIPTELATAITLNSGEGFIYVTLASASGSNTNPLPVELISFNAKSKGFNTELHWTTATEINNLGFEIERSINDRDFQKIGFVKGNGTSTIVKNYSFIDENKAQGIHSYRLKQIDNGGGCSYSKVIEINFTQPTEFNLSQNYPNPFNPTTTISYSIPKTEHVKIELYNSLGQRFQMLVNEVKEPGNYETQLNASNLSSGVYFYKIQAGSFRSIKKMVLTR